MNLVRYNILTKIEGVFVIPTIVKIKINDAQDLRQELDLLYDSTDQITLAKWALTSVQHILDKVNFKTNTIIFEGFKVNQAWQEGRTRMHDVRQAGFKVHALAKGESNDIHKTTLRVVGQAIATGHMREHAMVASDYAIKVINLLHPNDKQAITEERQWQIRRLKEELERAKN